MRWAGAIDECQGAKWMLDPTELFPEVPNIYDFPSVHAGMLYDDERVAKYSTAIRQVVKEDDVVEDRGVKYVGG